MVASACAVATDANPVVAGVGAYDITGQATAQYKSAGPPPFQWGTAVAGSGGASGEFGAAPLDLLYSFEISSSNPSDSNVTWSLAFSIVGASQNVSLTSTKTGAGLGVYSGTVVIPISSVFDTSSFGFVFKALTTSKTAGETLTVSDFTADVNGFGPRSAVPEPASWGMMIVGLFGAGAVLRRRRSFAIGA